MSRFNRHRRDGNHKVVVKALRGCGCSVRDLSQIGDEGPDLLVGIIGRDYQVEVKDAGGALSVGQTNYIQDWLGTPIVVLWSADDAIRWVNVVRSSYPNNITVHELGRAGMADHIRLVMYGPVS